MSRKVPQHTRGPLLLPFSGTIVIAFASADFASYTILETSITIVLFMIFLFVTKTLIFV